MGEMLIFTTHSITSHYRTKPLTRIQALEKNKSYSGGNS